MARLWEKLFKWLFLGSLLVLGLTYGPKDRLPEPDFYAQLPLDEPLQHPTLAEPFMTEVEGQQYRIDPRFDYQLEGVVVSYHHADSMTDIWHRRQWQDFLNVKDLCVIWGENVASGVYRSLDFENDSWTCWVRWPDAATASRFRMHQFANNHLLTDDEAIRRTLMSVRVGDRVHLRGFLASYANPANGFRRGTSTLRTDTGQGACETVFVREFTRLEPANPRLRRLFEAARWLAILSLMGFLAMFALTSPAHPAGRVRRGARAGPVVRTR